MKRRHRSYNYKFTGRTHSKKGIVGLLASLCSIGAAAGLILNSFFQGETASIYMAMGGFGRRYTIACFRPWRWYSLFLHC